jgi:hypothetical protein
LLNFRFSQSVITRLVRVIHLFLSRNDMDRPHKAGDDDLGKNPFAHLAIAAAIFAFSVPGQPSLAQSGEEKITDYASDITVERNGALDVTETISVVALDDRIRHGIYRDFPTRYADRLGRRVHVGFDVVRVTRDGQNEPYSTESISNGVRVKIGSADTILPPGPHRYTLSYITTRQIGFFKDYDELYWNVTGNGWIFPIDHASANIRLPEGAHIKRSAYYTGAQGADGKAASARQYLDNAIHFETTAPLGPEEGLTVAVGFSKGAVAPPSRATRISEFIRDNGTTVIAALGVLALLVFYLTVWWEHGRDPRRGVIVPLFAPPNGLSPAAIRYIHRMDYDRKVFAAALIDMAVKGYLKISQASSTYTLTRTGKSAEETALSSEERAIGDALFDSATGSIELKQDNHSDIAKAISSATSVLKREDEKTYFVTNSGWFAAGVVILILTAGGAALLSDDPGGNGGLLFWLAIWTPLTGFLWSSAADTWRDALSGPGSRVLNGIRALFKTGFALIFVFALVGGIFGFGVSLPFLATAILIAGGILVAVFHRLLKAPTALGGKIRDQIDGFQMFLSTAETQRLEILNPPDITPQVFEKFLPYAIALDAENQWSKKFEAQAEAAGRSAGNGGYTPGWYSGGSYNSFGSGNFVSGLGASLASAAASASTAPGSSSGSGGGGFSGGGGGGGGGGGW